MKQPILLLLTLLLSLGVVARERRSKEQNDRAYWSELAYKVSSPLLNALSKGELKTQMPVEAPKPEYNRQYAHLEAFGRLVCGIAPWLELGADETTEGKMRGELIDLTRKSIRNAVDPASPDYMNFSKPYQPLVDAAFLAQGFLRAPKQLWEPLDEETKCMVIDALKQTRTIKPWENNWLLFAGMVEAFFLSIDQPYDTTRLEYGLKKHEIWYKGDGVYGDGPDFHWDYYNSFVIQPMLVDIYRVMLIKNRCSQQQFNKIMARTVRYAQVLERMISPEGTFPPIGRSLAYRTGCMQVLSMAALEHRLPKGIAPSQVRGALTAVAKRMFGAEGTFDNKGWLRIGFAGHQPCAGESYICTGSLYLCSVGFLHLGLPIADDFWSAPVQPWTSCRAWGGEDFPIDHALKQK